MSFRGLRAAAGIAFGAGIASAARAAEPITFGPETVMIFGADVPVWSAIFGVLGVSLARRIAPATGAGARLGRIGNAALTLLLTLGVLALIVSGEKRPIVALGWAMGTGFTGLGFIEMVANAVVGAARLMMDGFAGAATKMAAAWAARRGEG